MRLPTSGPARAALGGLIVLAALAPAAAIRSQQGPSRVPLPAVAVRAAPTDTPAPIVVLAVARLAARDALWRGTLLWNDTVRWNAAVASRRTMGRAYRGRVARVDSGPVSGECGGDLPPCCVLRRESGGNPTAQNPVSSASGLWQFLDSTWGGYGGYQHAKDAPASVQNERARIVYAGGRGASHWAGPGC